MTDEEELLMSIDTTRQYERLGLIRAIAVSVASFIAEIDASSSDVADYIERRLAPLADQPILPTLKAIAAGTNKPTVSPTSAVAHGDTSDAK
jgi:hypothetical protein